MTLITIRSMLAWCSVINMGLLIWWFLIFFFAHDWVYRFHSKWYQIPRDRFDAIHYAGIAFFKILILMFNLVPYLALRIIG
ncbi:MAG: hypothetical protein P1P89_15000 [Desulfobacterales bacterium]|nr:hypothetical protein [Desulfobacterales bacterium]